jgi:cytochrome b6-f complex iron-sulfur subunit
LPEEQEDEVVDREEKPTRRDFFVQVGVGACAVAAAGSAIVTLDYLEPKVLFEPSTKFVAGSPLDFADGVVRFNKEKKAYIIGSGNGIFALSAVCTHLGCITRYKSDEKVIACPCHGSRFDLEGHVVHGPAPRPLPWLDVTQDDTGNLVVDTGIVISSGKVFRP